MPCMTPSSMASNSFSSLTRATAMASNRLSLKVMRMINLPKYFRKYAAPRAATALRDGRILLVYNHSQENRFPLSIAVSEDDGQSFKRVMDLETAEPGGYSYPAIIESRNGIIHIKISEVAFCT